MQHHRCPFLQNCGDVVLDCSSQRDSAPPAAARGKRRGPLSLDDDEAPLNLLFGLFHGPSGVRPLKASSITEALIEVKDQKEICSNQYERERKPPPMSSPLPLAVMSLGGMPDFLGDFFRHHFSNKKGKPGINHPHHSSGPQPSSRAPKLPRARLPSASSTQAPPSTSLSQSSFPTNMGPEPLCPLRKMLGPMAGFVFTSSGQIQCPAPILAARAVLAATPPIQHLRPQALHVKLAAVGAIASLVNIPCGMWREHTKKFSFEWFLAVHTSIPFIAMLRKAVIMPKIAIVCTIAAAIAGQALGAQMERERLKELEEEANREIALQEQQIALRPRGRAIISKIRLKPSAEDKQKRSLVLGNQACTFDSSSWKMEEESSHVSILTLPSPIRC